MFYCTADTTANFANMAIITKKKDMEHLQVKDSTLKLDIKDAKVHFANLFNGNAVLSQTTNDFLNDNSKDIVNEIKPAIESVIGMLIDDLINKLFKTIPYDKLFPK